MEFDRRTFLRGVGGSAFAAATLGWPDLGFAAVSDSPESLARQLHHSLSESQRRLIALPWDHVDGERGLLRARVSANWNITAPSLDSDFYSSDQRALVRAIYEGLVDPGWHERYDRHLLDDAGGWGKKQSIAMFGEPDAGPFQFVMTGRHMTMRAGSDATNPVAFGGPIFYGHATGTWWSGSFVERAHHPGNVFFAQAKAATALYDLLDGDQRTLAHVSDAPNEADLTFDGATSQQGLRLSALSPDQLEEADKLVDVLVEPFRSEDRAAVRAALASQGGLGACKLSFFEPWYRGGDELWDSFRLDGPSLTWHFRGDPHVHVWVHVASQPEVPFNSIPIEL